MDQPGDLPTSAPEPPPLQAPAPPSSAAAKTSPWVWVAVAMSTLSLLVTIAVPLVTFFVIPMSFGIQGFDEDFEDDEPGYYVEQESVIDAVEEPCEAMVEAAEKIRLNATPAETTTSLHAWTTSAQAIVTAIDGAKPNEDSREWRDDWKATIAAVDKFAGNIGKPQNRLSLPSGVEDMFWETDAECGVPIVIASLDPDYSGYMLGE